MTPKPRTIADKISRVPIRIEPRFEDAALGVATGFIYLLDGGSWLVTNWHVVAGRHPTSRQPLNPAAAIPDSLCLHVPFSFETSDTKGIQWRTLECSLYKDQAKQESEFLVHPVMGERVDIAAIELGDVETTAIVAANSPSLELDLLRLRPSLDVFVVGFPLGMYGGAKLPVWKRGSIASEPDLDIDGLPRFLIDTATREGMSGAPVYAQETGLWLPEGESGMDNQVMGTGRRFVGVYSGRLGADDEFKAQLGIVWKASALQEVIRGGTFGTSSFHLSGRG